MVRLLLSLATCLLAGASVLAQPTNLLANPGFAADLTGWTPMGSNDAFEGADGALRFTPDANGDNIHLDQTPKLKADTIYHASIEVRAQGKGLAPSLRIAGMDWNTVAEESAPADGKWHTVSAVFYSARLDQIRYQLFGAGRGKKGAESTGNTWFRNPTLRPGTKEDLATFFAARITVDPSVLGATVNPLFFGVNSLFWITDDKARADGKIAAHLKDMGCTLIRFPGGEVADNYHWQTNRLDNTKDFPYEDGPEQLDFDEFMAWVRTIGAEPSCVINLESGFLHGDVAKAIKEAADWVRYANITQKYGVKYWEIGNETDLVGTRYPLTAEQYGQAVRDFSKAMKAVDPTIQIGALGAFSPKHAVALDRLSEAESKRVQALPKGQRRGIHAKLKFQPGGTPWWPTVCKIAGGHFDFAIVHRYDGTRRDFPPAAVPPLKMGPQIRELDDYLKQQFGKEIPIALTEWNVWRNATGLGKLGHALTIAEQMGCYLTGGVDMGNYWPMRYPRGKAKKEYFRGLLNHDTKEPRAVFHVFKLFRKHAVGRMVPVEVGNPNIYAFATQDEASATLFLINRLGIGDGVQAQISFPGTRTVVGQALVGADTDLGVRLLDLDAKQDGRGWTCHLPPHSLAVLRFAADPLAP